MQQTIRGQYQVIQRLGAGGMGEVYQARDTKLNRFVAIKVLTGQNADPDRRKRFFLEAQAASALNHPNIITIYDIVSEEGSDLMIMEYVAGKSLSDFIPRGGLRVPQVINYGLQMADALATAHTAGIIHRDLKPANIMVTDRDRVKVLDFGLAKMLFDSGTHNPDPDATQAAALTIEGSIVGTLCYMSPEQAQGKPVDQRSDIFSFGALLYEMVTGLRAFMGDNAVTMLSSVLRDQPKRILEVAPDVPPELETVIERCLRKDPDERWQSMQEVHAALKDLKQVSDSGILYRSRSEMLSAPTLVPPLPLPASTVAVVEPPSPKKRSNMVFAGLGIAAVLLAILGGYLLLHRTPQPAQTAQSITAPTQPAETTNGILNNDSIISMVKAKVPSSLIASQIHASKHDFDLSTQQLIRLVEQGVPESIIAVMRHPEQSLTATANPPAIPPTLPLPPAVNKDDSRLLAPTTPPAPTKAEPPAAPEPVASASVTIPDSTPIRLTLNDDVPLSAEEGTPLELSVLDPVMVDGSVVVAKGAPASGAIAGNRKRIFGHGGKTYQLISVKAVDGHALKIRPTPSQKGGEGSTRPLESIAHKSKDLTAAKGSVFIAYVAGDQVVKVSSAK